MVPQIKVDGISIFKVIQVALMGKDKSKYSSTEAYMHTQTFIIQVGVLKGV